MIFAGGFGDLRTPEMLIQTWGLETVLFSQTLQIFLSEMAENMMGGSQDLAYDVAAGWKTSSSSYNNYTPKNNLESLVNFIFPK